MTQPPHKILIIEDEAAMLDILSKTFTGEGFDVVRAKNGEEGLALAFKEKPELILLDIIMTKMDGLTMLQKLREDSWGASVPVIMLTNLSTKETLAKSFQAGAIEYLIKTDWSLEKLVQKVKEKLG